MITTYSSTAARISDTVTLAMVREGHLVRQEEGDGEYSFYRAIAVGTGASTWEKEAGDFAPLDANALVPVANLPIAASGASGIIDQDAQEIDGAKTFAAEIVAPNGIDATDAFCKGQHKSNDGSEGIDGSYTIAVGDAVVIKDGLIVSYTPAG